MEKKNGVKHSMQINAKVRRKGVIERLETQLKTGVKCKNSIDKLPLTNSDITRINHEIEVLKTRI